MVNSALASQSRATQWWSAPKGKRATPQGSMATRVTIARRMPALRMFWRAVGPTESSSAVGVNGNENDNSAPIAGAAYAFVRNGTNWTQQAYLKASNTEAYDEFGARAAVSGDTVVVGAFSESSNAAGVNGNQNDNSASASGAAY